MTLCFFLLVIKHNAEKKEREREKEKESEEQH
jgi:hypothetical protein